MTRIIKAREMGKADFGWLRARYHFSFANYHNSDNMNFGVLRVLNDDYIAGDTGFDMHPHRDMEIVTYVLEGALTHGDSMGNRKTLTRGDFQYMSAGTGVFHEELNESKETIHSLQIWILPDAKGHEPQYGDLRYDAAERQNKWFHAVSPVGGDAPIRLHQDVDIHVAELEPGMKLAYPLEKGRQVYLIQAEGSGRLDGELLEQGDAAEIQAEGFELEAVTQSHYLIIEMKEAR